MDSTNARFALSALAVVGLTAISLKQAGYSVVFGPSRSVQGFTQKRHIPDPLAVRLKLHKELDLRELQCLTYLLAAFGPNGFNAPGCASGTMVASPSRPDDRRDENENENYFFQWPRDGALCLREVIRRLILSEQGKDVGILQERASELEKVIRDFVDMNAKLQYTANPSGTFETGGLGEPKFNVDGSPYEDDWGRPQNDGPALRAIALLGYANYLIEKGDKASLDYALNVLYRPSAIHVPSIIKNDLDYTARMWESETFELWEESKANQATGGHFHTLMVQRRALLSGANLAMRQEVKDTWSAGRYRAAAIAIGKHLEQFWNPNGELNREKGPPIKDGPTKVDWSDSRNLGKIPQHLLHKAHVNGTLSRVCGPQKPCQVDTAVLLAFTHGWDGNLTTDSQSDQWLPWGDRCLATLDRLVDVFNLVYPINAKRSPSTGVLCGRYPEDVYDGVQQSIGHPWFICTHAVGEILAITAQHFASAPQEAITVSPHTQSLWNKVSEAATYALSLSIKPEISPGAYLRGDLSTQDTYEILLAGLWAMSDGYLRVCGEYVGENDVMAEQIERARGSMRGELMEWFISMVLVVSIGARELSWSYASFMAAMAARRGTFVKI